MPRFVHFMPDQVALQVRYPADAPDSEKEKMRTALFAEVKRKRSSQTVEITESPTMRWQKASRSVKASLGTGARKPPPVKGVNLEAASLAEMEIVNPDQSPCHCEFPAITGLGHQQAEWLNFVRKLEDVRLGLTGLDAKWEVVTLNWLTSGAQHGQGTGGPATRPVPYRGERIAEKPAFTLLGDLGKGAGVTVVILDTAHAMHDLAQAYYQWTHHPLVEHPLVESLLNPETGKLHMTYAPMQFLASSEGYRLEEHTYRMPDHGLFAAGLINTIAPEAGLELIEVLNPYGVGTLESILWGFQQALSRPGPLVINCSLCLNAPYDQNHDGFEDFAGLSKADRAWLMESGGKVIKAYADMLFSQGSLVVAAAGNEWNGIDQEKQPPARYPAAFPSVLGVGALDRSDQVADYSNQSDRPRGAGALALGGEAGEDNGILGVYLGEFPDGAVPSPHPGWAWWAGTSFATPVVSGLVAAQLGAQPNATAWDAYDAVTHNLTLVKKLPSQNEEDIFDKVKQSV